MLGALLGTLVSMSPGELVEGRADWKSGGRLLGSVVVPTIGVVVGPVDGAPPGMLVGSANGSLVGASGGFDGMVGWVPSTSSQETPINPSGQVQPSVGSDEQRPPFVQKKTSVSLSKQTDVEAY